MLFAVSIETAQDDDRYRKPAIRPFMIPIDHPPPPRDRKTCTIDLYRARQLYKNISMLFLFPVKDGKFSTGVNATFDASYYG